VPSPSRDPQVQQLLLPTHDSTLASLDYFTLPTQCPHQKRSDPTPISETQDNQLTVQIEQSTTNSITVSNSTEASNDAPAVPKVRTSWNPPLEDDMANGNGECEALNDDDDDDDIMQVEHMRNDIPLGRVTSPGQSNSSGRIETGPGRRRSSSPPIELRRSSRRPSHSRSSTEHCPGSFDDDERPLGNLPATKQHQKTCWGSCSYGKDLRRFTSNNVTRVQTESEQFRTEMLLRSRPPTCAAGSRQRYIVVHSDNERYAGSFLVDGAGEHG